MKMKIPLLLVSIIILYSCLNDKKSNKQFQSDTTKSKEITKDIQSAEMSKDLESEDICFCSDPEYKLKGCEYEKYRLKKSDLKKVNLFWGESTVDPGQEVNSDEFFIIENISKETFLNAQKTALSAFDKRVEIKKQKNKGVLDLGCISFKDTVDPNDEYSLTYELEEQLKRNFWFLVSVSGYEDYYFSLINGQTCDTVGVFDSKPLIHPNGKDMFVFEYSPYEPTSSNIYRYKIVNNSSIRTLYRLNFKKDINFSNDFISSDGWIYFINEIHYRITGPTCNICDYYRIKLKQ